MKVNLRSVLEQWTLYRRASEEINGYLMEGRYSVSRLRLLNGSLEAVQQQVESLEVRSAQDKLPSVICATSFKKKTDSFYLLWVTLPFRAFRRKWINRKVV